ncbi:MAG: hypothetical protein IJJ52_03910 [Lachnospiraceae bacterium]|nr:hypothetical protein [Lachnospiraceae bacterium]
MIRSLFLLIAIVSVLGIAASQILLTIALLKKDSKISTRTAGMWILGFLMTLTVSVTVLMLMAPRT